MWVVTTKLITMIKASKIKFQEGRPDNKFLQEWKILEKEKSIPRNYKKLIVIEHKEFVKKILENNHSFAESVVNSIYNGDLYILKNTFSKQESAHIIDEVPKFTLSIPSSFHKMHEGVPNFHRWIESTNHSYALKHVKHATYLFPWNKDISNIYNLVEERCSPLKFLAGLNLDSYKKSKPLDGIIERLQITRYPPTGFVEPHIDAEPLMRLVISGYLTRRGKHYNKGGFYMIDENNKKLDLEDNIEDGDVGFFYATLRHGVDQIDPSGGYDSKKKEGRWWIGYNIHHSDYIDSKSRATGQPYNINSANI